MPWRPEQALHSDSGLVGRPNPPAPLLPFAPLRGSATAAGSGREKPESDDVMKVRAPSSHHHFPVTFQLQRPGRSASLPGNRYRLTVPNVRHGAVQTEVFSLAISSRRPVNSFGIVIMQS